ncbi:hypothetical protein AURDEDRAFT_111131 [Auricularia subglabra TFB-10046 SS5]|nr:hypothetical protein AURDEDRAFT_111131 [Auricularia subglabra TFB-10046 SS5]
MWEEGVLHRDVSWFNVLCKPKHYLCGDIPVKPRPCIRMILHCQETDERQVETSSEVDLSPTVLLADLDHAVEKDAELLANDTNHGRERTGTPMFISYELSDYSAPEYDGLTLARWAILVRYLTAVDKHDRGAEVLRRAFPDDNGEFLSVFHQVKDLEACRTELALLPKRPVHKPRHDAESIYWVLLWSLARAQPRNAPREPEATRLQNLTKFANCLLEHKVGDESARLEYIRSLGSLRNLLHADLAAYEDLLIAMASYLAIPWHIYPQVKDNHVHMAFRRMLLGFLLDNTPATLDRALNTEQPRRLIVSKTNKTVERLTSPFSESLSSVGGSGRADLLDRLPALLRKSPKDDNAISPGVPEASAQPGPRLSSAHGPLTNESLASGSSTGSKKRKVTAANTPPPPKRPRTSAPPANKPRVVLSAAERARKASKYVHTLHHALRCAHALRLKVWNDRNRWFTKG